MKKKCIVLYSGGLDSRLAVRMMQEQKFEVTAVFFKLPFGCSCNDKIKEFLEETKVRYKLFDCNKGKLLEEYLEVLKKGEHGRGAGANPCRDCKIFMFKKAGKFGKKLGIDLIVTGEVLGERPMSQMKSSMQLIEEKSGLKGKILRPLSAKVLPETEFEKKGLVNRTKLLDIHGRRREKQIALAKKFKIKYPEPAGGCLLCEKNLKKRFEFLFERGLNEKEVLLSKIGRHFIINNYWIVLGRNQLENEIIEKLNTGKIILQTTFAGPTAAIMEKSNKDIEGLAQQLIYAYSKEGNIEERKLFDKFKI